MSYSLANPYLQNYWNCSSCNYHNKGTRSHCNRCKRIKQSRTPGDWNCLSCDQLLPPYRDRCTDCNITREGVPLPAPLSVSTPEETEPNNQTTTVVSEELCTICLTNRKNSIFLHGVTAHQGACYECASRCNNVCPLCRQRVDRVIKLY